MLITLNSLGMSMEEEEDESGNAPHFSQPLKARKINPKLPLTLECVVVGTPAPALKWFTRNREITSMRGKKITYNPETGVATLKILKPTPEDFCSYSVQAVNSLGSAECRIDLTIGKASKVHEPIVLEAPKITQPLEAKIVCTGEPITLESQFDGTPLPTVKWYHKGKEVLSNTDVRITTSGCKSWLQISEAYRPNSGKYEIQVVNCSGEARSSGTVSVTEPQPEMEEVIPPRFVKPPEAHTVAVGEVVILETFVESYPTSSFQWFQQTLPITFSSEFNVVSAANHSILLIDKARTHHTGTYTCRAENVGGSVTYTTTINVLPELTFEEVKVFESPRFVKKLTSVRVMDGEEFNFVCQVVGKPIPHITWFHENEPLKEEKDFRLYQDSEGVCKLSIDEVFPEDAGVYTCRAVNPVGEVECTSSLIVEAYEYVPDSEIASEPIEMDSDESDSEEEEISGKISYWRSIYDPNYNS